MKTKLTRREFLKLAGLAGLSYAAPSVLSAPRQQPQPNGDQPNVLIVVFDSWAAPNCSLYGYPRDTTPNINRLAEKATVYHNHYAGGIWTIPGTTSLLTGMLPWDHGVFDGDRINTSADLSQRNLFYAFQNYHRMGYSHNQFAHLIMQKFLTEIDNYTPREQLFLDSDPFISTIFGADEDIATVSLIRSLKDARDDGYGYSLYLARLYDELGVDISQIEKDFPLGIPTATRDPYILEDSIDWLLSLSQVAPQPYLGYYHLFPPHHPYKTHKRFFQRFKKDGYQPTEKTRDIFGNISSELLFDLRRDYDEFMLYADYEFNRLYESLQAEGILENTWLILTSDHGEMFERGIWGHTTPALYQTVVNVPLLIFEPGQQYRRDVYDTTSAIDIVPTLAHIAGQPAPSWVKGRVMPPYNTAPTQRDVFIIESDGTKQGQPIPNAAVTLHRGQYKLLHTFGYTRQNSEPFTALYNLETDPEELNDLSSAMPDLANEMLQTIKAKLTEVNAPYLKN